MKLIVPVLSLFLLSSCHIPEPLEKAVEASKRLVGMAFQQPTPVGASPAPSASPSVPENNDAMLKANAELLSEVIRVTFAIDELEDQDQFRSLLSSLQQGASIEGIYRGLVMASRYRTLESRAKAAAPNAVKFFALEMANLQLTMKNPTKFDKETAKNYPSIDFPEGLPDHVDLTPTESTGEGSAPRDQKELAEEVLQAFIGGTSFTLKRVMAEEILKKFEEVKNSPSEAANWYATTVVRLNASKIDFGVPQRNSTEFDFHQKFANTVSSDRLKWEVLNRYHRIFNQLN